MSPRRGRRIVASRRGGFDVRLSGEERAILASLPGELVTALAAFDPEAPELPPGIARLFPVAYPRDEAAETSFSALMRRDLLESHREALSTLERTARAGHLDDDELEAWLQAVNDLRLVLGSALDVREDDPGPPPGDPRQVEWACYHYLSFLEGEIVDVLSGTLPPADDEGEDPPEDPWGEPLGGLRWDGTPTPEPT